MMIVVSAEGEGPDARPCPSFGRSPFLVFVDTETDAVESIPNPGCEAAHGAGVEAGRCVVAHGASVVCSGAIGPNAWDVCEAAGVEMLQSDGATVREVVGLFLRGALQPLTPGAARHAG